MRADNKEASNMNEWTVGHPFPAAAKAEKLEISEEKDNNKNNHPPEDNNNNIVNNNNIPRSVAAQPALLVHYGVLHQFQAQFP